MFEISFGSEIPTNNQPHLQRSKIFFAEDFLTTMPSSMSSHRAHYSHSKSPTKSKSKQRHQSKERTSHEEPEWSDERTLEHLHGKKKSHGFSVSPTRASRYSSGGGGGDDHDDPHESDDSGSEDSHSGSDDNSEDSEYEENGAAAEDDDMPPPAPNALMRTESVVRKKKFDDIIDDIIEDDDDIDLLEARLKIMKAKKKANNIFTVSDKEFDEVQEHLESTMKYAIRNEVWNLITKGHHLQLRRELLKDKVSRAECIDHFFRVNNVSHRMSRMASTAAKTAIDYARNEDLLREDATGNFMRTGNFRSTPRKAPIRPKMDESSSSHDTRGRKRKQSPVAHDIDNEAMHTPTKSSGQKKKKHSSKSKHSEMYQ